MRQIKFYGAKELDKSEMIILADSLKYRCP
jgi:hypothetical protein